MKLRFALASPNDESDPGADRRVVISDPDGVPLVFGWRRGAEHWLSLPDVARFKFRADSNVVTACPVAGAQIEDVTDAYHKSVLPIAVQISLRGQAVHAGAVTTRADGVVAFGGPSGAGKTTIAIGLARRGFGLWADDIVGFSVRQNSVIALRLPFVPNLRDASARFFDALPEADRANGGPAEWTRAPLSSFCVLERIEDLRTAHAIERLSSSDAFIALLEQSFRFKPQSFEEKRRMMHDYLEAAIQVPVFRVRYRPGFEHLETLLDRVEEAMLGGATGPD